VKPDLLAKAAELASKMGYVFVATANSSGKTHLAAAKNLSVTPENQVRISDWFCPETMQNLCSNNFLSIVAWDPAADYGFQLLGELVDLKELGMMNGYVPDLEKKPPIPQIQREMVVRVDKIIDFKIALHSDAEE
jgi:hypothetical protein